MGLYKDSCDDSCEISRRRPNKLGKFVSSPLAIIGYKQKKKRSIFVHMDRISAKMCFFRKMINLLYNIRSLVPDVLKSLKYPDGLL